MGMGMGGAEMVAVCVDSYLLQADGGRSTEIFY